MLSDARWKIRGAAVLVALATLVLMLLTEPKMAIVWDEGFTLGRQHRIRQWFSALKDPAGFAAKWVPPAPMSELVQQDQPPPRADQIDTRAKLYSPAVIEWFWPFAREEPHGHPPFYALVGLIGDFVVPGWADLPRARFGPILIFSLTAGALFGFAAKKWGVWPAALASCAWIFQPQIFSHGHYAAYDALLTCLWVNAIIVFDLAIESPRKAGRIAWSILLGLIFGCAADTKLTGWFLPIPFLFWAVAYRSKAALQVALIAAPVALITLYVANPGWWAAPVTGIARFLKSNLSRGTSIPIKVMFLGRVYNTPLDSLPWYNTLAWTIFVVPAGFLCFGLAGAVRAVRRVKLEPFGVLVLGHWLFLLLLRSLPHTPGHDGVRLFLPAFGVLAILAGQGAAWLIEKSPRWGGILSGVAIAEGAISLALMMPVPMSYFSPLAGGLPGAAALGMEPTYYWDALGDDALDFLNKNTPPDRSVAFASFPHSFIYLRQTGKLTTRVPQFDRLPPKWYVIQNRPGSMSPHDRALIAGRTPAFVSKKWGVPLLWIFPIDPTPPTP